MRGLTHTAQVYRQVEVDGVYSYPDTPNIGTWPCHLDPISPELQLREDLALSTHRAIGAAIPVIEEGDKLVIGAENYFARGVRRYTMLSGTFSQQVLLSKSES